MGMFDKIFGSSEQKLIPLSSECQAVLGDAVKAMREAGINNIRQMQVEVQTASATGGLSCQVTPEHVKAAAKANSR